MKILHIDETFHPSYGYHTAPLSKQQSCDGHEVFIITVQSDMLYPVFEKFGDTSEDIIAADRDFTESYGVKIIRVPIHKYVSGRAIYKNGIIRIIHEISPDIIYAHLVESLVSIQLILRGLNYPIIFDSHMLAMASGNRFVKIYEFLYRAIIAKIIENRRYTVVRTQDDCYVNTHLGIKEEFTPLISFGTDTDLFKPDSKQKEKFHDEFQINDNDYIVIYTGKLTEEKGALFFAESIKEKFILEDGRGIVFIVIGNSVGEYGERVEKLFSESENRILRFPLQKYLDLPKFYQAADISIFPRQCSLSFFDVQSCGLPVILESNDLNKLRISHNNGICFKPDDNADLRKQIFTVASLEKEDFLRMSRNSRDFIVSNYSYKRISEEYYILFDRIIREFKKNNTKWE